MYDFHLDAYYNPRRGSIELYARGRDGEKGYYYEGVKKEVEEGGLIERVFSFHPPQAQELMDTLWNCGIRPLAAKSSIGQVDAMQAHLDDMRKLVFDSKLVRK